MTLRIGKNSGSGATWHILNGEKTICGSISDIQLKDVQDFEGLDEKPTHGSWCGVCRRIYKTKDSFKTQRTTGGLYP